MKKNEIEKTTRNSICLVWPPLVDVASCPPAGIPSLVAYLKSRGYNPTVVDFDLHFNRNFPLQNLLLYIQNIFAFIYRVLCSQRNKAETRSTKSPLLKHLSRKYIFFNYKCILFVRKFFLDKNVKIPTLKYALEIIQKESDIFSIEKCIKPILKRAIRNNGILGISVTYPSQVFYSLVIAKFAKEINKEIFVVLGGSQITMNIKTLLNDYFLTDFIDGFVVGDGEAALYALLNGEDYRHIPNIFYKERDTYLPSEYIDYVLPIKEYAIPDFTGFDLRSYIALPLRTVRGCLWGRCRFCTYPSLSNAFEMTSAEFVIESIMELQKQCGMFNFEFIDSCVPASFLRRIAENILKNNLSVTWKCRASCEEAFKDIGLARILSQSGCTYLAFGVESCNERVLKSMNKMQRNKTVVINITKSLRSQNIGIGIYAMFGFPTETKKEMEETFNFLISLKNECSVELMVSVFNLLEHTYTYNNPSEFKITKIYKVENYGFPKYGYRYECSEGASREEVSFLFKRIILFNRSPFLYRITNVFF